MSDDETVTRAELYEVVFDALSTLGDLEDGILWDVEDRGRRALARLLQTDEALAVVLER